MCVCVEGPSLQMGVYIRMCVCVYMCVWGTWPSGRCVCIRVWDHCTLTRLERVRIGRILSECGVILRLRILRVYCTRTCVCVHAMKAFARRHICAHTLYSIQGPILLASHVIYMRAQNTANTGFFYLLARLYVAICVVYYVFKLMPP